MDKMRVKKPVVFILLCLLCPLTAFAQVLPIQQKYIEDGKKNWSWAASAQAVMEYFGVHKSQAEIGDYGTNGYDVPNFLQGNGDLNRHGVDEIILKFGGIRSLGYNSTMTPGKVFIMVNHFRVPVIIRWARDYGDDSNTGPGDRIIVLKGAKYRDEALYLMLMDPVEGTYEKDYGWVVKGSGHVWAETLEIGTRLSFIDVSLYHADNSIDLQMGPILSKIGMQNALGDLSWDGVHPNKII